jgi:hypothetical protein
LDLTLQELSSAKKIIQMLQEDMNATPNQNAVSTGKANPSHDLNFETVNPKPRRRKLIPNKWENNMRKLQQTQPIPVLVNKYVTLDGLQLEQESSQTHSRTSNVVLSKNKRKCRPKSSKSKIVIIGDSHARGMAVEISSCLGRDFEVNGTVMPGARLENITNLSDAEMSTLGNNDAVIIWGGANDISENEVNNGLKHLKKFVSSTQNTNIIVVAAPHRHDLQDTSCMNKEIEVFNRKLHKIIKTADNVKLLHTNLNRNDFTRHGLHLNISGKEKIAELIGESIKNLITRNEETPIILKWKENQKNPTQEEDDKQEPNLLEVRSSRRQKRNPTTRNGDFLWTAN